LAKKKAHDELNRLVDGINDIFDQSNLVYRIGDGPETFTGERIPTWIPSVDLVTGGGVPKGKVVEIYGPESSGKTTVALCIVSAVQAMGGLAAFVDTEHALDPVWATRLGVNVDELIFSQPDYGEQALDVVGLLVDPNIRLDDPKMKKAKKRGNIDTDRGVDLVVLDSVAGIVPKAEIMGKSGDSHVGVHARLMSQHMRRIVGAASKKNACVVYINQIRHKIGVMFGSPETTPGGFALKFHASVRMEIRRAGWIGTKDDRKGIRTSAKVVKSKVSTPYQKAFFDITGEGVDMVGSLIETSVDCGVVAKKGSSYTYGEERFRGASGFGKALRERPDLANDIYLVTLDRIAQGKPAESEATETETEDVDQLVDRSERKGKRRRVKKKASKKTAKK